MNEIQTLRPSDANVITRNYLDSILIEERLIDAGEASLDTTIFGKTFQTPIMMPAFSHLKAFIKDRGNAMTEYAAAAKKLGMLNWVGMCENEEFGAILDIGVPTVRMIKPYADRNKVLDQIAYAEEHGAFAVGMDIDHIFGANGCYDVVEGEAMARQTMDDIRAYAAATKLPFIVKGILSAVDAKKCVDCGVRGLVVSHHHGRMPFAVPPLMVLPEIRKALGSGTNVEIFVDCGIDSGADAFKAIAMGADAAAVGRVLLPPLMKNGAEGIEEYVGKMNDELKMLMGFTGFTSVDACSADVLWQGGHHF